ncbi:hypothetical protein CUC53_17035, partial [Aeromonas cavernicola]
MYQHLNTLYQGHSLSRDSARDAFGQVVRGEVDPIVLASLLTALKIKGETPEEIAPSADDVAELVIWAREGAGLCQQRFGGAGDFVRGL